MWNPIDRDDGILISGNEIKHIEFRSYEEEKENARQEETGSN